MKYHCYDFPYKRLSLSLYLKFFLQTYASSLMPLNLIPFHLLKPFFFLKLCSSYTCSIFPSLLCSALIDAIFCVEGISLDPTSSSGHHFISLGFFLKFLNIIYLFSFKRLYLKCTCFFKKWSLFFKVAWVLLKNWAESRVLICCLPPHTHRLSTISFLHQRGSFVTINKPTLAHHYHLKSIVTWVFPLGVLNSVGFD